MEEEISVAVPEVERRKVIVLFHFQRKGWNGLHN